MGVTAQAGGIIAKVPKSLSTPKYKKTYFFSCRNIGSTKSIDDLVMRNYHLLLVFIFIKSELSKFEAIHCCESCAQLQNILIVGFSDFNGCTHSLTYIGYWHKLYLYHSRWNREHYYFIPDK